MKKALPLLSANVLFLFSMLLVITLGEWLQARNLALGLIVTEIFFIFLPALMFLQLLRIPPAEGLRLGSVGVGTALLCLLLGVAVFLFSVQIDLFMMRLTGQSPVTGVEGAVPGGTLWTALLAFGLAVLAPFCEEALFRGAIQGAYEKRRSALFAITLSSLMFVVYHFRLSGAPTLIPVAFILGWVAWRTQSIWASILVHFGLNAASTANTLLVSQTGTGLPYVNGWSALGGVVVTIVILVVIHRLQAAPPPPPAPGSALVARRTWLGTYWPLVVAAILYLVIAGVSLFVQLPKLIGLISIV